MTSLNTLMYYFIIFIILSHFTSLSQMLIQLVCMHVIQRQFQQHYISPNCLTRKCTANSNSLLDYNDIIIGILILCHNGAHLYTVSQKCSNF